MAVAARHDWSWQSLARRVLQRDENTVGSRKKEVGPQME